MSEKIKEKEENLEPGEARSPYTSYTEYLGEDSKKLPDFMMDENYEFLGSEDI